MIINNEYLGKSRYIIGLSGHIDTIFNMNRGSNAMCPKC